MAINTKGNINGMEIRVLLKNQEKESIRATMGSCTKVLGSLINSLALEVPLLPIVRNIPGASTVTTFTVMADIVGLTDHMWKEYFSTIRYKVQVATSMRMAKNGMVISKDGELKGYNSI